MVNNDEYDEEPCIVAVAHGVEVGHHVFNAVFRSHGLQQDGLYHGNQSGRGCAHPWRVGKDVCQQPCGKSPEKYAAPGVIEREIQQKADVDQWCGIAEQVHVVEHQRLQCHQCHQL